jgi:predicted Rossmann fold flavoprotein
MQTFDVIIIGAGAAGLMCAIEAGKRNKKVLLLDHANKFGKKILMSGGGFCNFTNYNIQPNCYISHNPHFCKSALSRYTQWDFIKMVERYKIPYHEKTLGQLFCDNKAKDIVNMLLSECKSYNVNTSLNTKVFSVKKVENKYHLQTSIGNFSCNSLVIATGGLSIPTIGSSPFGYKIAKQFGIKVWPTKAGLVPFTLHVEDKNKLADLAGISFDSVVSNKKINFRENSLLTHRGLSGPAMLQMSSYWRPGEFININFLPEIDLLEELMLLKNNKEKKQVNSYLTKYLANRLVKVIIPHDLGQKKCIELSANDIKKIINITQFWQLKPNGTEGYKTAEVTLGGVDCNALSSKTMECNKHKGLYFVGEVLDVTGWLGGYNFQWAWSSGYAAGLAA